MILLTLIALGFADFGLSAEVLGLNTKKGAQWRLQNSNGSIDVRGTVPGGVYSDLQKAGVIGDILQGFNDVRTRWVAYDNWTYTAKFNGMLNAGTIASSGILVSPQQLRAPVAHLVLEGLDTVARVQVNGAAVAATDNMFVRYVLNVKRQLKADENVIKVAFASPVASSRARSSVHFAAPECVIDLYHGECHANQLRKMQASFAWDWGPAFPSVGLWRSAFIEFYNGAIIREVTTHLEKKGREWKLKITAHLESSHSKKTIDGHIAAELLVNAQQKLVVANEIVAEAGDVGQAKADITLTISENVVSLWWPNGYGRQPLYDLRVSFRTDKYPDEISEKRVKMGFRTVEVVEQDASVQLGNSSAGQGLTFYFKVNGYPLFMKGSNWIPAHILPELGGSKETVNNLLLAAREAHMAMLRVWGGGVYESEYFYERCDQLGILVWQDFLFACSMYPVDEEFISAVKTEIVQNVVRLQHHASIAVWVGNNENEVALRGNWYGTNQNFTKYKKEYVKLYVDTIKPIVEALDPGRRYLVSSPSNGRQSEKEGYIADNPYDPHYGDTHYYNYIADSWNPDTYPQTRFASEYGFQSLPSIITMKTATKNSSDYSVTSEYSKHRQHSPMGYQSIESQLLKHLRLDSKNDSDHFEQFVFYSQISQAMAIKTETEFYRQSQEDWFTMGALYWQLNDVWQAPSWSGIEYGGRWKMLHYYAKAFFAPVLVSPRLNVDERIDVFLLNDRFVPIVDGKIRVDIFNWSTPFIPIETKSYEANVPPLSSKKQDIDLNLWDFNYPREEVFLRFSLKSAGVHSSPYNFVFPVPLKDVKGLSFPKLMLTVSDQVKRVRTGEHSYTINIRSDAIVLFLWLETELEGKFDDNGFILTNPYTRVNFLSRETVQPSDLQHSITYKYYLN